MSEHVTWRAGGCGLARLEFVTGVSERATWEPTARMPVTTVSAAVHITPGKLRFNGEGSSTLTNRGKRLVVVKTFLKHYKIKGQKLARGDTEEEATDDIFFDE
jgi:hypothetical protein